jgi:hypothetical protein
MAWEDKDGLEKNIEKMSNEWNKLKKEMKPHWLRFFKRPYDGHSFVNLFVESRRISPYFTGHIDSILYPVLVGINAYFIIKAII